MSKTIYELVDDATEHLSTLHYCETSRGLYLAVWRKFKEFCVRGGKITPDRETGNEFLVAEVYHADIIASYKQQQTRIVMCLFDFAENGSFPLAAGRLRIPLPEHYGTLYTEYANYLESEGKLSERTIYGIKHSLKKFLNFLEANNIMHIDNLKTDDVYAYVASEFRDSAETTRAGNLYFLRDFLRYLVEVHSADSSLAKLFPVILSNKDAVMPSYYEADELRRLIAAHNPLGSCAKRNRAVVLLALQLGLRASDIRTLQTSQIDWRNRSLSFLQYKTKRALNLPLPEECMFAILDYMKNERPKHDSTFLFLKGRAPYGPVVESNTFHQVISECFKKAKINVRGKHFGLHSLRHSTAVNMLMSDTPYPVISGILGHTSANTTKTYLKTDVEKLRLLSLEVPHEC